MHRASRVLAAAVLSAAVLSAAVTLACSDGGSVTSTRLRRSPHMGAGSDRQVGAEM